MGHRETVLEMIADGRIVRAKDLRAAGIPSSTLFRMAAVGELETIGRGLYRSPEAGGDLTALSIAGFAARYPGSLCCLMSAARFHRLTDDMHSDWTVAMPTRSAYHLPEGLRLFRWLSPEAYEVGVETVTIEGTPVRMTDPARTVADMVRGRNGQSSEHALGAYAAYLAAGGEPEEVARRARALGFEAEVSKLTPFARRMLDGGAFAFPPT